jgi:multiple sugar transport system permease protein/sn-glycerol 3-phosphate transport system permease protein
LSSRSSIAFPLPAPTSQAVPRSRAPFVLARRLAPYAYVFPAVLLLVLFTYWPIAFSAFLSVNKTNLLSGRSAFVGLDNFETLLGDPTFLSSLRVTLLFTLYSVPARLVLALLIAHVVRGDRVFGRILRGAYFLPYVTSSVAISVIFSWMFNTDLGVVNNIVEALGGPRIPWLQQGQWALVAIAIVAVWKQLGYDVILYVAALNAIPGSFYEAAAMDGATARRRFFDITIPLVAPTTLFLLLVSVIQSLQVYTLVNIITQGGPAGATNVLMHQLYYLSFVLFDVSSGSAVAMLMFVILIGLAVLQFRIGRDKVVHELG